MKEHTVGVPEFMNSPELTACSMLAVGVPVVEGFTDRFILGLISWLTVGFAEVTN